MQVVRGWQVLSTVDCSPAGNRAMRHRAAPGLALMRSGSRTHVDLWALTQQHGKFPFRRRLKSGECLPSEF